MRLSFICGDQRINIGDGTDSGQDLPATNMAKLALHEAWQAERFVRWNFTNADDLRRIRSLLARQFPMIHRADNAEVLRLLSRNLQSGNLCAYASNNQPNVSARVPVSSPAQPSETPRTKPAVVPRSTPFAPLKAAPVLTQTEQLAQDAEAARQEEAAREAIPFCEICNRKLMESL